MIPWLAFAPSQSLCEESFTHRTVSSGSALPFRLNSSHPASKGMNTGFGIDEPRASSTR
jgi:hypothetical protein